jgi:hypothetical protein
MAGRTQQSLYPRLLLPPPPFPHVAAPRHPGHLMAADDSAPLSRSKLSEDASWKELASTRPAKNSCDAER